MGPRDRVLANPTFFFFSLLVSRAAKLCFSGTPLSSHVPSFPSFLGCLFLSFREKSHRVSRNLSALLIATFDLEILELKRFGFDFSIVDVLSSVEVACSNFSSSWEKRFIHELEVVQAIAKCFNASWMQRKLVFLGKVS
jgi:hypothetical protein